MVEEMFLDDFGPKMWIGIRYREPRMDEEDVFPTVIRAISNRNPNPLEDYVDVSTFPSETPRRLKREFIKDIWKIDRVYH